MPSVASKICPNTYTRSGREALNLKDDAPNVLGRRPPTRINLSPLFVDCHRPPTAPEPWLVDVNTNTLPPESATSKTNSPSTSADFFQVQKSSVMENGCWRYCVRVELQ